MVPYRKVSSIIKKLPPLSISTFFHFIKLFSFFLLCVEFRCVHFTNTQSPLTCVTLTHKHTPKSKSWKKILKSNNLIFHFSFLLALARYIITWLFFSSWLVVVVYLWKACDVKREKANNAIWQNGTLLLHTYLIISNVYKECTGISLE